MNIFLPGLLAVTLACSHQAHALTPSDYFGNAVASAANGKTIVIDNTTRFVNVNYRDTVTFVLPGRKVTWHFDGISSSLPLSKILELDPAQRDIIVYVASIGDL